MRGRTHQADNLNWMCDCFPSGSMPVAGQWVLRDGFAPRVNPRRPNIYFAYRDIFQQSRDKFFVSFYHRSQESAKIFDAMKRRVELAYEQRRKSEASRLRKTTNINVIRHLERIPLSKNVTLTVEIPNAEHASMMERMEAWCNEDSIPQIMQDTGVLIQFPDLMPEVNNAGDYVNRVTLTGPLANVEQARIRIRNFTPIAISFPLRTLKPNILIKDVKNIIDKAIAEKIIDFPNLEIMVQSSQLPKDSIPSCVVRGTPSHERDICDACAGLHRLLFDAGNDNEHSSAMIYSTVMDIPVVQQLAVTGVPDGCLIRMISLETDAIIYFPTISDHRFGATVFYLYGSVHAIMRARKYIQGLLPVRLIFDVENNDLLCPVDASNRELFLRDAEHDLTITMKKSRLEGEKITANDTLRNMVIIESGEYNLTNVYAMRRQLLRNHVLKDEPLIVTKDFDFFKKDFKALIARNNQVIVEVSFKIIKKKRNVCSNNSQAKTPSLLYSQLNQNRQPSSLPPVPVISSPVMNGIAELLPQIHVPQEVLHSSENENIPLAVAVDGSSASKCTLQIFIVCLSDASIILQKLLKFQEFSPIHRITGQEKVAEKAVTFSASPSSIVLKEQNASDGVNMSVPQFMDLFRRNKNKGIVMIPTDDAEKPSSKIAIPQKMKYIRNIDRTAVGQNFDKHLEGYNFDVATNNANCDLTSKTIPENILKSKYLSEKSSVCTRLFTIIPQSQNLKNSGANVMEDQGNLSVIPQSQNLENSGANVMEDQGNLSVIKMIYHWWREVIKDVFYIEPVFSDSTTRAIASAMLQNTPSQWFQSSGIMTAIKSRSAQSSKASSPEKTWQTKKNLPLKSSFTNENYIREYYCDISTDRAKDMPQGISARESKEASSDLRLSSLSNNHNTNSAYSISRSNPAQNSSQYRLFHQNKNNTDDAYGYRKDCQSARIRDNTIWGNSRHSSSLFHAHSNNTREIFSKTYQGRINQNSSQSGDMIRAGRTMKQSTNRSGGYHSTFSRFQSTWSLSSGHSEGKKYSNRAMTHFHLKRQFLNGAQLKEKGKDDQREDECLSRYQEQQHGHISDQFRKAFINISFFLESEELKNNINDVASPSVLLIKTKIYADITEGVDVVLIDEVQRSQNEQSSRSVQQLNSPFNI
uniref:KH_10 domain-containing protein n=1 Tax=Onchocerca volvulus TaxID=6282 RepID=A0A8R1Y391_ONCVO